MAEWTMICLSNPCFLDIWLFLDFGCFVQSIMKILMQVFGGGGGVFLSLEEVATNH